MIQLVRVRTAAAIPKAFRDPARLNHELALLKLRRDSGKPKSSHWSPAKKQLRKESGGKCAYCEGPSDLVAHADVEHFRPKAVYWWLAYCYDNYLYACQICNQVHKSDKFPIAGTAMKGPTVLGGATDAQLTALCGEFAPDPLNDNPVFTRAEFVAAAKAEKALLVDPYLSDPEPVFKWAADEVLKEVRVAPRTTTMKKKFDAAEDCFGLNREELRRWRWERYKDLRALRDILDQLKNKPGEAAVRTIVEARFREMMADTAAFAGMCRYFIRDEWGFDL